MGRVLFHHQASPALARRLRALEQNGLAVEIVAPADAAALAMALPHTEVLWHVLEPVTAAVIAAAPGLRLIQKMGVGVNTIDLDAARARGIAVCNMPGTNTAAVGELTLALMLACVRRLVTRDPAVRAGEGWRRPAGEMDGFGEIGGRTGGVVGYGAVPQRLAPVLRAVGADVLYWTRAPKRGEEAAWRPLERLLDEADIVSLHLPLTPETERLIDRT